MAEDEDTIGARIVRARKRAGLTSAKLAAAVGCTPVTVWRWERGIAKPTMRSAQDIAKACRVSLLWLAEGTGKMVSN